VKTPNGVKYSDAYFTPDGVVIKILRGNHSREEIMAAKRWIRGMRDVVGFVSEGKKGRKSWTKNTDGA